MVTPVPRRVLPEVQNAGAPNEFQSARGADAEAFGSLKGRGMEALGAGLINLGNSAFKIGIEEKEKTDATTLMRATQRSNELERDALYNPTTGLYAQTGDNAAGIVDAYAKRKKEIDDEVTANMTPAQKLAYEKYNARSTDAQLDALARRRLAENIKAYDEATGLTVASETDNAVAGYTDPNIVDASLNKIRTAIIAGSRQDSPELLDRKLKVAESKLRRAIVDRLVDDNVEAADKYYQQHREKMTAEDIAHTDHKLALPRKRLEALKFADGTVMPSDLQALSRASGIDASALNQAARRFNGDPQTTILATFLPEAELDKWVQSNGDYEKAFGKADGAMIKDRVDKALAKWTDELRRPQQQQQQNNNAPQPNQHGAIDPINPASRMPYTNWQQHLRMTRNASGVWVPNPTPQAFAILTDTFAAELDRVNKSMPNPIPFKDLRAVAAAFVGNSFAESGFNSNVPHDNEGGKPTGYGLFGHRDPGHRPDRKTALLTYLQKNGYEAADPMGQVRFAAMEALTHPRFRALMMRGANIQGVQGAQQFAVDVRIHYESPDPAQANDRTRISGAIQAYNSKGVPLQSNASIAAPAAPAAAPFISGDSLGVGMANANGIKTFNAEGSKTIEHTVQQAAGWPKGVPVFISAGTNDAANGFTNEAQIAKHVESLAARAKENGNTLTWWGPVKTTKGWDANSEKIDAILAKEAAKHGIKYISMRGQTIPLGDGVHPDAAGYKTMFGLGSQQRADAQATSPNDQYVLQNDGTPPPAVSFQPYQVAQVNTNQNRMRGNGAIMNDASPIIPPRVSFTLDAKNFDVEDALARAQVQFGHDPQALMLATQAIRARAAQATQAQRNEDSQILKSAWEHIAKGGDLTNLPPETLSALQERHGDKVERIEKFIDRRNQGKKTLTNWGEYYKLQQLSEEQLVETNLWEYRDRLGDTEFKQLTDRQRATRDRQERGEASVAGLRTNKDLVTSTLRELGIDTTNPKPEDARRGGLLFARVEEFVTSYRAENKGKSPSRQELQEHINWLKSPATRGLFGGTNKYVFELGNPEDNQTVRDQLRPNPDAEAYKAATSHTEIPPRDLKRLSARYREINDQNLPSKEEAVRIYNNARRVMVGASVEPSKAERKTLVDEFTKARGRAPTDAEIQTIYGKWLKKFLVE